MKPGHPATLPHYERPARTIRGHPSANVDNHPVCCSFGLNRGASTHQTDCALVGIEPEQVRGFCGIRIGSHGNGWLL